MTSRQTLEMDHLIRHTTPNLVRLPAEITLLQISSHYEYISEYRVLFFSFDKTQAIGKKKGRKKVVMYKT
jgi:hypothetical protein